MSEFPLAEKLRRLDGPVMPDDRIADQIWERVVVGLADSGSSGGSEVRIGRGIRVAAVACLAVLAFAVPMLFFEGDRGVLVAGSASTDLVSRWIEGAVDGEFGEIAQLTYGEFGEPQALDRLARQIRALSEEDGPPRVEIFPLGVGDTLEYTCVDIRFSTVDFTGALVTRTWPDLGMRLWEFRPNTQGCPGYGASTTTMPDLSGVGDPLPHGATGPEPRFDTSGLGEEVRLVPIDVRMPPLDVRAEGEIAVIGRVEGTDVEIYLDTGDRECIWFIGRRLAESVCRMAEESDLESSIPAYAVTRSGLDGEPVQTILVWEVPDGTSVVSLDAAGVGYWQRPIGGHVVFALDRIAPPALVNVTAFDVDGERLGGSGVVVWDSP